MSILAEVIAARSGRDARPLGETSRPDPFRRRSWGGARGIVGPRRPERVATGDMSCSCRRCSSGKHRRHVDSVHWMPEGESAWTSTRSPATGTRVRAMTSFSARRSDSWPAARGCSPSRSSTPRGLVDLTALGWPALEVPRRRPAHRRHLHDRRARRAARPGRAGRPSRCSRSARGRWSRRGRSGTSRPSAATLPWRSPAGAMITLCGRPRRGRLIWTADGGERRVPVDRFVTGAGTDALAPGDLLRTVDLPADARCGPARRSARSRSPLGRSGALLAGRRRRGRRSC